MDMIRWFDDIRLADAPHVGGKGANLGELCAAGLPVPPGLRRSRIAWALRFFSCMSTSALASAAATGSGSQ